jgi:hypothetical protein
VLRFAAADAPSRSQLGSPAYPQCDREHGMHHGLHLDPVGMPKRMRAEFTFSLKKIAIGTSVVCRCQKWSHRATIACREQAGTPMRSAGASLHQAVIYRRINRLRRSSQCGLSAPAGRPLPRFAGRRFKALPVLPGHRSINSTETAVRAELALDRSFHWEPATGKRSCRSETTVQL